MDPKIVPVKVKRVPALIKKRESVKLEQKTKYADQDIFSELFDTIAPPTNEGFKNSSFDGIDINDISEEQLSALRMENFALWVMHSNIEVDHQPFNFEKHLYLLPLYLDDSREIVLMKAAQMGATIWMLLRLLWFCSTHSAKACLYFPTLEAVQKLSKDRLKPLIDSNSDLIRLVHDTETLGYKRIGESSSLYLQHMGGEATKDSTPFDFLCFDEVRLLNPADIDQARERLSHSRYKNVMQVSTAGMPSSDIHRAFLGGTQNYWFVRCNCHTPEHGFIPSENWPDCMAVTKEEVYLRCPKCGTRILDAQNGRYFPANPSANYPSYHISQLISKYITPAEIWDAWQRTQNLKEFYNAKLGKPYVDEENRPLVEDDLRSCENHDLLWGPSKTKYGGRIQRAMGVDQMSGVNYVLVAERYENKKRIVHYEIIDDRNPLYYEAEKRVSPFKRVYELMKEMDIDLCIIDAMPNINEAVQLALTFPKRVFVAHYIESLKEMVQWGDRPKHKITVRRGGPRIKFKYTCFLSRYHSIDFALSEIANRNYEWPHPRKLVQVCRSLDTGLYEPLHIFETHFYKHLQSIVRQKTWINELAGTFKMEWVNLGLDPHSCHSLNLCNIALERLRRQPFATFLDT